MGGFRLAAKFERPGICAEKELDVGRIQPRQVPVRIIVCNCRSNPLRPRLKRPTNSRRERFERAGYRRRDHELQLPPWRASGKRRIGPRGTSPPSKDLTRRTLDLGE